MSNFLQPCGLQHTRLPCSSLPPRVCSNSFPLSQWCHPTVSSSAAPFFSFPQRFPASGAFPMGQLFTSGGQIIGASGSVLLKYFLNPRFYDFVTWWLRTMFKDWDAFQSRWVWFQALGRLGLSLRAVRGSLGSVRSSEPSTQQLGPSYLCSQEVLVLVFSANWEREESRSFQAFSTLAEKKKYIKVC